MMKKILLFAALAAVALCACQKEPAPQEVPDAPGTGTGPVFTAVTEGAATKTALSQNGESYDVVWRSGDRITIVDGAATPNVGVYSTTSTTTSAKFTFADEGTAAAEPSYRAWYPASIYNAGTPTLPATQDYVAGNISGSPMYAESGTTSLSFKNLCGIIRLNISTTMEGKSVKYIALSANEGMSGAFTITNNTAVVSDAAGVKLDCGEGVGISSTPTAFYISVPANTYNSLTITVWTTDNLSQSRIAKGGITVTRSSITDVNLSFNGLAASSLVQQWPFDGNALNAIPSGVNATVNGATLTTDRFGNENSAYYFDGNDWMSAAGAANFGTSSFSANVWVCSTQSSGSGNILRTDNGYSTNGWLLRFNSGKIEIWEGRSASYAYFSSSSYADGKWHMLTFVRDVENLRGKLYVDGNFVGEYTISGTVNNVSNTLTFGTYGNHDGEFYCGKMDDVRMFDKALSPAEITALYRSSATDLSATASANCYIVPAAGNYKFRATVKGNGLADLGGISRTTSDASINSASLVWATFNTTVAPAADELIKNIRYVDGYVYFSTGDVYKEGNALVAIKDASDNILWSWHLWFESDNLVDLAQTYPTSGYVVMDRNLGALTNCYAAENALDFGFAYQNGRKDPFMMSATRTSYTALGVLGTYTSYDGGSTLASSILRPTVVFGTDSWGGSPDYWTASTKTIFDPCPPGWRVGNSDLWSASGFNSTTFVNKNDDWSTYHGCIFNGVAWFPATGDRWGSNHNNTGSLIRVWTRGSGMSLAYGNGSSSSLSTGDGSNPGHGYSVRCVRE